MRFLDMREELKNFYWNGTRERAEAFRIKAFARLDPAYHADMTSYEMKMLQHQTITDLFEPVLFYTSPFYYETGTMWAHCDGARGLRGSRHAGGWTHWKNEHLFKDQDEALFALNQARKEELFYITGGPYNDTSQHFNFDIRPILKMGLSGLFAKAETALKTAVSAEETQFLTAVCNAMRCLKRMSEKFAARAAEMQHTAPNESARSNMRLIAETAARVPWNKPETFYEALNAYAFMRKAFGTLDGVGPNTFGRPDMDLYPFYENDLQKGILTEADAYDLICQFLITWDMHFDRDFKMEGYSDHELENTYVLGGCDANGEPLYNALTKMFLQANREEKIIFPKIKCRYAKNSPKEYLDEINQSVINGTSTVLYQNDDATIPALLKIGKTLEEARDYLVTGCWAVTGTGIEKYDDGGYVNMLKAFEFSIHNRTDKMAKTQLFFQPIDEAKTFDEVYQITCDNIMLLFSERARVITEGGQIRNKVDPLPIFSSTMQHCIEKKKDYTAGGAKYQESIYELVGFPNIVDSLLAIKELCFDTGKYTLKQMLTAVRNNWNGFEDMRQDALHCHGWGDGSAASSELAEKFNSDIHKMASALKGTFGGKIIIGHLTYTEIRFWGLKTLATPDGRFSGDYITQGLTPSRLKKISAVTNVINSLKQLDASKMAGNSVVNIILPNKISLEHCEAFLRAAADSALQSLQLNCTSKEQLLDAQKHPEKYPDLIVRVCGFSAKFTSLSPEWQQEVLTRNFYD